MHARRRNVPGSQCSSPSAVAILIACALTLAGCYYPGGGSGGAGDLPAQLPDRPGTAETDRLPQGAISWTDARAWVGTQTTVCGDVVDGMTARDSKGSPTFLNIGVPYPQTSGVTVLIWGENLGNFPSDPVGTYLGQSICVKGELYDYEGYVQVEASSPAQIRIAQ